MPRQQRRPSAHALRCSAAARPVGRPRPLPLGSPCWLSGSASPALAAGQGDVASPGQSPDGRP
eukprot:4713535-Alexandrium_andersonii.AAC.1